MRLYEFIMNVIHYGKCIMWSRVLCIEFSASKLSWMRLACLLKIFIDTMKNVFDNIFICLFPYISISPPWSTKHTQTCHKQDDFIYKTVFIYSCLSPNISNLYNPDQILSLSSQKICEHMFSDMKLNDTFHVFFYSLGFFSFLLLCGNCLLTLKMGRFWNPLWVHTRVNLINSVHNIISYLITNQIRNTTWRSISKI